MKITFKDGSFIEDCILNVSISNVSDKNGGYVPMVNIIFKDGTGFTDIEPYITKDNTTKITVSTSNGNDTILEGFNKIYMNENISDESHSFSLSLERDNTTTDSVVITESLE